MDHEYAHACKNIGNIYPHACGVCSSVRFGRRHGQHKKDICMFWANYKCTTSCCVILLCHTSSYPRNEGQIVVHRRCHECDLRAREGTSTCHRPTTFIIKIITMQSDDGMCIQCNSNWCAWECIQMREYTYDKAQVFVCVQTQTGMYGTQTGMTIHAKVHSSVFICFHRHASFGSLHNHSKLNRVVILIIMANLMHTANGLVRIVNRGGIQEKMVYSYLCSEATCTGLSALQA
jgi:hypothetical protein